MQDWRDRHGTVACGSAGFGPSSLLSSSQPWRRLHCLTGPLSLMPDSWPALPGFLLGLMRRPERQGGRQAGHFGLTFHSIPKPHPSSLLLLIASLPLPLLAVARHFSWHYGKEHVSFERVGGHVHAMEGRHCM